MLEKCGKGRFKLNNPIYNRKEKGVENTTDSQDDKDNFWEREKKCIYKDNLL